MPETDRVKPRPLYVDEAIQFALESRWAEALATNEALLDRHGSDEDTYNRMGKALTELGRHQEALAAYQNALQLNPLNLIAQKNSRKLLIMLQAPTALAAAAGAIDVDLFAEEPGKSGLTLLTTPAGGVVTVAPGDTVELVTEADALQARTVRGVLLGEVDAKLGRRLLPLMASGNRYSGAVARVENDRIEVIIRETFQSPENVRKSSFPISRGAKREDFRPYAKESLIARDDDARLEPDDFDDPAVIAADADDDLPGMQTVDSDPEFEDVIGVDDDDDDEDTDVDVRPEDEY